MNFYPYESISIQRDNGRVVRDKDSLRKFWNRVNELDEGLSEAIGCYIFSIRASKGILPLYVGLAERQPFRKECFKSHKLVIYNECLNIRKGTPVLTLIPRLTRTGRFCKPSKKGHKDVRFLETLLIASCLRRNSKLMNVRDTKMLREMVVPGFLNTPNYGNDKGVLNFKNIVGV